MRVSTVAAAMLRPQLRVLPQRIRDWNARYARLAQGLAALPELRLPRRPPAEQFVGSSLQFFVDPPVPARIARFCEIADELGVHVKWFGAPSPVAFTSAYPSWAYADRDPFPGTDAVLAGLCDIRVPLALPLQMCDDVVTIIAHALAVSSNPSRERGTSG